MFYPHYGGFLSCLTSACLKRNNETENDINFFILNVVINRLKRCIFTNSVIVVYAEACKQLSRWMGIVTGAVLAGNISGAMALGMRERKGGLGTKPPENVLITSFCPKKTPYFSTEIGHLYTKKL